MLRLIELLIGGTTRLLQREATKYQRKHERVLSKIDQTREDYECKLDLLRVQHADQQRALRLANIEACAKHAKCERLSAKLKEIQA